MCFITKTINSLWAQHNKQFQYQRQPDVPATERHAETVPFLHFSVLASVRTFLFLQQAGGTNGTNELFQRVKSPCVPVAELGVDPAGSEIVEVSTCAKTDTPFAAFPPFSSTNTPYSSLSHARFHNSCQRVVHKLKFSYASQQ